MSTESVPLGCVLDIDATLARLGGDRELLAEMVGFFEEDAPQLFAELQHAAAVGDAAKVRMCAHSLKGLLASCGGVRAASAAQKVETAGEAGDLTQICGLVENLGGEFHLLRQALAAYRA